MTTTLTIATALGSATFGGAMYAFSAFVMHALDRTPTRSAVEAMQQINLSAPRPPLVARDGRDHVAQPGLVVVAGVDLFGGDATTRPWLALAGCAGFLASMAITGGFHIPRNNALATSTPTARPRRPPGRRTPDPGSAATTSARRRPWPVRIPGAQPDSLTGSGLAGLMARTGAGWVKFPSRPVSPAGR